MTPMVRVCCVRRERATTLGRYFISAAAAKTRSWVTLGMERAAGAAVRTRETVATERPRWVAIVLRPTERGCASVSFGRLPATFFPDFAMREVSHICRFRIGYFAKVDRKYFAKALDTISI